MIQTELNGSTLSIETTWRSRDGTVRPLSSMDNNHIENACLMIQRNQERSPEDFNENTVFHNVAVFYTELQDRAIQNP